MPTTKSAKKRLRTSLERRTRNRTAKKDVRTHCRKVEAAVEAGKLDEAQTALRVAAKKLDQAAAKKIIHTNAASRTKSRLAAKIKSKAKPA